jgi:hypothetical protein
MKALRSSKAGPVSKAISPVVNPYENFADAAINQKIRPE